MTSARAVMQGFRLPVVLSKRFGRSRGRKETNCLDGYPCPPPHLSGESGLDRLSNVQERPPCRFIR